MTETQRKALQAAEDAFRRYADHHAMKGDETKARANTALAGQMSAALAEPVLEHRHIAQGKDLAWQAAIFHEEMDKLGIPRDDGEDFYSLWGRVDRLQAGRPPAAVPLLTADEKLQIALSCNMRIRTGSGAVKYATAIEQAVRKKAGLQ